MVLHNLIADSALCCSHLLLCSKVPILGADMRKNPSACQPGKNTPKIEQRKQTQTALNREVAAWWSVNASFWAGTGEEGWGVGKSWGTTVWAASIPAKVIEKVILGIISKHTRDKETIRESQHSFTTFSHNMLTENLIKQSRQGGELKLNSQVQEGCDHKVGWRNPKNPILSNIFFIHGLGDGAERMRGQCARGSCCCSGGLWQGEMDSEELQELQQAKGKVLKCGWNSTLRTCPG